MNRRRILATAGSAITASIAGCSSVLDSDDAIELAGVSAVNYGEESRTLSVDVLDDGSVVHSAELRLEGGGDIEPIGIECGWPESGEFVLKGAVAENNTEAERSLTEGDGDCFFATFEIDKFWESVGIWVDSCEETAEWNESVRSRIRC